MSFLAGTELSLRPPARRSLSQWADRYFYLSPESSADTGRWKTLPYQRGIMDAITDPEVEFVTLMKSARIGYTKIINAAVGYYIDQDPCPIMVVQPTVEDAQGYSKEEIAPMLRDVEVLAQRVKEPTGHSSEQTILHKTFAGGSLSIVGATSGRGFRRVSRRVLLLDEIDAYPLSAGNEGDPIQLAIRRTDYYANRKIIAGSTPLVAGTSRIAEMFEAGDRRRYHVPCLRCGFSDVLSFRDDGVRGHFMSWPDGAPEKAHFVCRGCSGEINHRDKRELLELGEWRAEATFGGHASFHIWAAYGVAPNAAWGHIAKEFVDAKRGGVEKLKATINTVLGETWQERGEAPDWERLFLRREQYAIGSVQPGVLALTAGVDVQRDRFVYEVVGWTATKESFSVEVGVLMGDTSKESTWGQLDALLARSFRGAGGEGQEFTIGLLAIDSGYNTQQVYGWARRYVGRVIAIKGVQGARTLIGTPTAVDVTLRGQRIQRGHRVWPIGVDIAKSELYGWLGLPLPGDDGPPPGYCHFPEYDEEYFRQLTAEQLVTTRNKKTGRAERTWQLKPNRENHYLDCRVYARAAVSVLGLDRMAPPGGPAPSSPPPPPASAPARSGKPSWLMGRRGNPGGWLKKRR